MNDGIDAIISNTSERQTYKYVMPQENPSSAITLPLPLPPPLPPRLAPSDFDSPLPVPCPPADPPPLNFCVETSCLAHLPRSVPVSVLFVAQSKFSVLGEEDTVD